ncbi:MAG: AMP-binding protein [Pseudomonadota bacterium]
MLSALTSRLRALPRQKVIYHAGNDVRQQSFPAMAADVERIAQRLAAGGIGAGVRVGILADNCYEWLVHDLALLQLGAICVPTPVEHFGQLPPQEVAERFNLALLLVAPERQRADATPWVVPMRLDDAQPIVARNAESLQPDPDPELFTLVFSSGTSGRLKCLKVSRKGTEVLIESFGRDFQFRPDDLILAFLPLSSFQQRWMMYASIQYGFDLGLTTPLRLFHALRDMRPTVIGAAPLLYETVEGRYLALPARVRRPWDAMRWLLQRLPESWRLPFGRLVFKPFHEAFGGKVRMAITGAAPIRHTTLMFFDSIGLRLYSAYGLTEAGFLSWNVPGKVRLGAVGREVYPGAVSIAGDGEIIFNHQHLLAYGYMGLDPEEEKKTFTAPGRIATGDIGRFDADGYLYVTGRKKDILITAGGYKIQPEDIERAVEMSTDVGRAVVFGGGDLPCVAVLVSLRAGATEATRRTVQAHVDTVNRTLPAPSRIGKLVFTEQQFTMDSGLLNRNLKVDRNTVFGRFRNQLMGISTGDAS